MINDLQNMISEKKKNAMVQVMIPRQALEEVAMEVMGSPYEEEQNDDVFEGEDLESFEEEMSDEEAPMEEESEKPEGDLINDIMGESKEEEQEYHDEIDQEEAKQDLGLASEEETTADQMMATADHLNDAEMQNEKMKMLKNKKV